MILPTFEDVSTVYDRLRAAWVLRIGERPGGVYEQMFAAAVFARAERRKGERFDLDEFMERYCERNGIDYHELMWELGECLELRGSWQTDPYVLMEVLSEP